jgi:glutamate-1-semialdehyde aminotransferase
MLGDKLRGQLREIWEKHNIEAQVTGTGSLLQTHFTNEKIKDAPTASRADIKKLVDYNLKLIANGIFFLPTHTGALSTAHSTVDMDKLLSETEKYAKS